MLNNYDLQQIKKLLHEEVDPLKIDMKEVKSDINILKSDSSKTRKDINTIVSFFDREYVDLRDRVGRIKEILKLAPRS